MTEDPEGHPAMPTDDPFLLASRAVERYCRREIDRDDLADDLRALGVELRVARRIADDLTTGKISQSAAVAKLGL